MVLVVNQSIPSAFASVYRTHLQPATDFDGPIVYKSVKYNQARYGAGLIMYVKKRYPFRLPHMQGL